MKVVAAVLAAIFASPIDEIFLVALFVMFRKLISNKKGELK